MPRKSSRRAKASRMELAERESERVEFAEVEFIAPVIPRLAVRFGDGLSVLVENERAVSLAAAFLAEFRRHRKGGARWSSLGNAALKIYVALEPCDMRKGFDGLHASTSRHLREGCLGGDLLFVFANRRRDCIKLLHFDGTGLWGAAKRLEKGRFSWPAAEKGRAKLRLRPEALQMLLDGVDLCGAALRPWYERPKP